MMAAAMTDSPQEEAAETEAPADTSSDTIAQLMKLDDAALAKKLGFADKVAAFKIDLGRANGLTGDARKSVNADLTRAFTPSDYAVSDLGYKVDRAIKKCQTQAAADTLLQDCGCCDAYDD